MDHPNHVGVATPVDLGPISLEDARTLRQCLANAIAIGEPWDHDAYKRCVALKAMLDLRIAQAQR